MVRSLPVPMFEITLLTVPDLSLLLPTALSNGGGGGGGGGQWTPYSNMVGC